MALGAILLVGGGVTAAVLLSGDTPSTHVDSPTAELQKAAQPDPTKPDSAKPDPTKPAPAKPDSTTPDPAKPDSAKPDATKPDPAKPDPTTPNAAATARLAAAVEKLAEHGDPAPPSACPPAAAADAAERVLAAREAITADADKAIASADQALALCPSLAAAHNIRGNALQKSGKLDEAGDAYARALQFAPDYAAPRFNLGIVQLRRKDPAAIATFSEILRRKPDDADAFKSRAQAYVNADRYGEAAADLEAGLKLTPDDARAWMLLGAVRDKAKRGSPREAYCKAAELGLAEATARCKKARR